MKTTIDAMKQAQCLLRWTHFGERRTQPVLEAREVDALLTEAIAREEAQMAELPPCVACTERSVKAMEVMEAQTMEPPNKWKDAVLNSLANHGMDAPITESPGSIMNRLVSMAVMMAQDPAIKAQQVAVPQGWKLILVNKGFDDLMYWLGRCEDKGHLDNCADLIEPWSAFEYRDATQPPQAERVRMTTEQIQAGHDAADIAPTDTTIGTFIEGVRAAEAHHHIGGKT